MDVAKYVFTVLLLSTVLSDISGFTSGWLLYVVTFSLVLVVVCSGLLLYWSASKDELKRKKGKDKNTEKEKDNELTS